MILLNNFLRFHGLIPIHKKTKDFLSTKSEFLFFKSADNQQKSSEHLKMFDISKIVKVFKTLRLKCFQSILVPSMLYFRISLKESSVLVLNEFEKIFWAFSVLLFTNLQKSWVPQCLGTHWDFSENFDLTCSGVNFGSQFSFFWKN